MVAYTDGVTDAIRADGGEFGLAGLQSTLARARGQSASEIVQRIVAAVDTFVGDEPQYDDLTLVVLKRAAPDSSQLSAT
jgi:sigma-B regulation protein RsbU (phosphoserine phosphatase)